MAISFVYCHANSFCIRFSNKESIIIYCLLLPIIIFVTQKWRKQVSKSIKISSFFLGFFLALSISVGKNFFETYYWYHCFGSIRSVCLIGFQTIIYGYVIYLLLLSIFGKIENQKEEQKTVFFNYKRWFWILFSIRIIFLLIYYPCIFDFDASLGLRTFLDPDSAICNHHPVFVQWIHAAFFTLGDRLGHRSLGFAILSICSIISSTLILLYGLSLLVKSGASKKWLNGISAVYAFFPLFPYLSLVVTKDGFFIQSLLLYVFSLYEIYRTEGCCVKQKKFLLIHILAIMLVCLTRHQGLYITLLEFIYIFFCFKKTRGILSMVTIPILTLVFFITTHLYASFNVEPGGKQELYGCLFHQTANYLTMYSEDVTSEELQAINTILDKESLIDNYECYTTDFDKREYLYNPRFQDVVKGTRSFRHVDHTGENEALKNYVHAWWTMGQRHPVSYIFATAPILLGFFYNNEKPLIDLFTTGVDHPLATTPDYMFYRNDYLSTLYNDNSRLLTKIPLINILFSIPYYLWFTLVLLVVLFYRKDFKGLSVFFPIILSFGILFICPVASGRYVLPIVVFIPFLLTYVIMSNDVNRKQL